MNKTILASFALILVLGAAAYSYFGGRPGLAPAPAPATPEEQARPDALLVTQSLADLPRDLRAMPLFQEVLTEDWFFFYQQNDRRLSLEGTLRRIAFEHDLTLEEQVLAYVFGTPARMALWKGRDGTLSRWILAVDRGGLMRTLELVAKAVLDDAQLKIAGNLSLDGREALLYELRYTPRRSLFFLSSGSRLWVASDRALLLEPADPAPQQPEGPADQARRQLVRSWLLAPDPDVALAASFDLGPGTSRHILALSARYLSFGYQRLFPALAALRLDFDQGQWNLALRTGERLPAAPGLWAALPKGAALCVAVPLEPRRLGTLLGRFLEQAEAQTLLGALAPPVALCWYPGTPLYAPLVAMRTQGEVPEDLLKRLFTAHIGTHEAGIPGPRTGAEEAREVTYLPPFEVSETRRPGGLILRREVSARHGSRPSVESPNAKSMRSGQYFPVTLALQGNLLLFSPHGALVEQTLATLDKRYPALADALPADVDLSLLVYPDALTRLTREAIETSLAQEPQETLFQASLAARLWPGLDKIKDWRPHGLRTPSGASGWSPGQWLPLSAP